MAARQLAHAAQQLRTLAIKPLHLILPGRSPESRPGHCSTPCFPPAPPPFGSAGWPGVFDPSTGVMTTGRWQSHRALSARRPLRSGPAGERCSSVWAPAPLLFSSKALRLPWCAASTPRCAGCEDGAVAQGFWNAWDASPLACSRRPTPGPPAGSRCHHLSQRAGPQCQDLLGACHVGLYANETSSWARRFRVVQHSCGRVQPTSGTLVSATCRTSHDTL